MQLYKSPTSNTFTTLIGAVTQKCWVPRIGPNGGRNIIDQIDVIVTGVITVAGAAWAGEDVARLAQSIRVVQHDAVNRWSLAGDASRIASYACLGAENMFEHADIGIAAGAAVNYCWQLPMAKPYMHTPEDFGMPAEEFKEIILDLNSLGDSGAGVATLTAPSLTFYFIAHVREEHDVRLHCVDEVKMQTFKSTGQGTFSTSGMVQDFIVHARGADGGASLANLTDARIDGFMDTLLRDPDLELRYRKERQAGNNLSTTQAAELRSDPFILAAPKAVAILLHGPQTSAWDGKLWDPKVEMKVDLTNTVADIRAIIREATPLTQAARNRACAFWGITPNDLRVATAAKSSRDITDWPEKLRPFLPLKAKNKNKKAA